MNVTIYYCEICQLRTPAEKIAAAVEAEFGLISRLQSGRWGTFRVEFNGETVFDRWTDRGLIGRLGLGHKPTPEEVVDRLRPLVENASAADRSESLVETVDA